MSDSIIAIGIPLAAIAIIYAWVPILNRICPPCSRSLLSRYPQIGTWSESPDAGDKPDLKQSVITFKGMNTARASLDFKFLRDQAPDL